MIDFFGSRPQPDQAASARIKGWVAQHLALPGEVTVMVTELRCSEPGCPPLETVIALLQAGQPTRQHKIHKGIADVTERDIAALGERTAS